MILQEKKELFDHYLIKAIQFDRELADKSVTDILKQNYAREKIEATVNCKENQTNTVPRVV